MSLFIREHPLSVRNNRELARNPFFDDFHNEFFNHPLIPFPSLYPYHFGNPFDSLDKQISKAFDSDVFKSVDFCPKINLSEDEKNYYIHADLPGMTKDQVKMELSEEDHTLTISGERETVIDNTKKNEKEEEKKDDGTKANETKDAKTEEAKSNESKEENKNGNKNKNENENDKKYSKIECSYGKFERSFSIPENGDINKIEAKMENGVLEVKIGKIETPKPEPKRSIQIM